MIALIMAAGKGLRIISITDGKPKCFLEVGGKRLIDHQIQTLINNGVEQIVIVIGYRCDLMEKEYSNDNITLVKNPFYDRTNVLASVWFAREHLIEGFYFMHADTYFDPKIFTELMENKNDIALAVNQKPTIQEDMKVVVKQGFITEINKEMACEKAYGEFIGLAKISKKLAPLLIDNLIKKIELDQDSDSFFEVIIQTIIDKGVKVACHDIGDKNAIEIDFPEDFIKADKLLNLN